MRGNEFVQDPDVLDTWFSSALWPFATLGWPQTDESLDYFYPTDLMITGRDILYLWVLRMAFTSLEFTGQVPFKTVLVHPTVMTRDGRRMSKSLGTGLNPMDLVRLYGADATRYSLLHQAGAMQDIRFDAEIAENGVKSSLSAKSGQAFCNKLWNAARFVLMNLEGYEPVEKPSPSAELADRWIRSSLARTIDRVDEHQEGFRFSEVTRALYSFLWNDYCDWYVELAKPRLRGSGSERALAQEILVEVLEQSLRLMHPVMPFITEALWQALPRPASTGEAIMTAAWPVARSGDFDEAAMEEMALVQEVVSAIRNIRGELRVPPGKRVDVKLSAGPSPEDLLQHQLHTASKLSPGVMDLITVDKMAASASAELLGRRLGYIETLALATTEMGTGLDKPPGSASAMVRDIEICVPLEGLIDVGAERQRLQKEIDKLARLLKGLDSKLNQSAFLEKAPGEVVARERQRQTEYRDNLARLETSLAALES